MEPEEDLQSRFALALPQATLGSVPPPLCVATGHDDHVMLFLLRVGDVNVTTQTLLGTITLAEADAVLQSFAATNGLIKKRYYIDDAYRLKEKLKSAGTEVEFVRPDDGEVS